MIIVHSSDCEATPRPAIAWAFEVYLKNPIDLSSGGWDIKTGWVLCVSKREAKEIVQEYFGELFDEFIGLNECCVNHPGQLNNRDDFDNCLILERV